MVVSTLPITECEACWLWSTSSSTNNAFPQCLGTSDVDDLVLCRGDDGSAAPLPRAYHSSILKNDAIIVFGGGNRDIEFADCWELNLTTCQWKRLQMHGPCPRPRKGHTACINKPSPSPGRQGACFEPTSSAANRT